MPCNEHDSHVSRCPAKILTRDLRNGHLAGQQANSVGPMQRRSVTLHGCRAARDATGRRGASSGTGPGKLTLAAMGATKGQVRNGQAIPGPRDLCQQVGDRQQLFAALRGLNNLLCTAAKYQTGLELAEQLLSLAQRQRDPALL